MSQMQVCISPKGLQLCSKPTMMLMLMHGWMWCCRHGLLTFWTSCVLTDRNGSLARLSLCNGATIWRSMFPMVVRKPAQPCMSTQQQHNTSPVGQNQIQPVLCELLIHARTISWQKKFDAPGMGQHCYIVQPTAMFALIVWHSLFA